MAGVFIGGPIIVFLTQGHDPLVFIGMIPGGVGLLMFFGLGRSAWIKAGESSITYLPAIGSAKVFPRTEVRSIARVPGARGLSTLEFRDQDNRRIVSCEESFARDDVEKLSQFLGVKLIWDLDLYAKPSKGERGPSWDEVKAQLNPEQLADLERHMKNPGFHP